MDTYITPQDDAPDSTEKAPDPSPQRSRRFDERGIALQTIIIMVVLIAIAGAIVVVIANRAGEETARLENQKTLDYGKLTSNFACTSQGGTWDTTTTPKCSG